MANYYVNKAPYMITDKTTSKGKGQDNVIQKVRLSVIGKIFNQNKIRIRICVRILIYYFDSNVSISNAGF